MKFRLLFILLFLSSIIVYGQTNKLNDEQFNQSGAIKVKFVNNTLEATDLAESDINKGVPFLLLQSGIAPVVYSTDNKFEEKFNVYYYESGCNGQEREFAIAYNKRIFAYLTEVYGKKWKQKIRKDVIGL